MNLIIITGKLKENPLIKGNVCKATLVSGKTYFSLVAFGVVAEELAKYKPSHFIMVQGEMQQNKYQEKYYWQVVVHEISLYQSPNALDNSEIIEDEPKGTNLDVLDLDDSSLPF